MGNCLKGSTRRNATRGTKMTATSREAISINRSANIGANQSQQQCETSNALQSTESNLAANSASSSGEHSLQRSSDSAIVVKDQSNIGKSPAISANESSCNKLGFDPRDRESTSSIRVDRSLSTTKRIDANSGTDSAFTNSQSMIKLSEREENESMTMRKENQRNDDVDDGSKKSDQTAIMAQNRKDTTNQVSEQIAVKIDSSKDSNLTIETVKMKKENENEMQTTKIEAEDKQQQQQSSISREIEIGKQSEIIATGKPDSNNSNDPPSPSLPLPPPAKQTTDNNNNNNNENNNNNLKAKPSLPVRPFFISTKIILPPPPPPLALPSLSPSTSASSLPPPPQSSPLNRGISKTSSTSASALPAPPLAPNVSSLITTQSSRILDRSISSHRSLSFSLPAYRKEAATSAPAVPLLPPSMKKHSEQSVKRTGTFPAKTIIPLSPPQTPLETSENKKLESAALKTSEKTSSQATSTAAPFLPAPQDSMKSVRSSSYSIRHKNVPPKLATIPSDNANDEAGKKEMHNEKLIISPKSSEKMQDIAMEKMKINKLKLPIPGVQMHENVRKPAKLFGFGQNKNEEEDNEKGNSMKEGGNELKDSKLLKMTQVNEMTTTVDVGKVDSAAATSNKISDKNVALALPIPVGRTVQKDVKKPTLSGFEPNLEEKKDEKEKIKNITKAKKESDDFKTFKNLVPPALPIPGGKTLRKDVPKPTLSGIEQNEEEKEEEEENEKKKDITKAKNEIEIDSKSHKNYLPSLPIPGGKTLQKDFKKPPTLAGFGPTEEKEENEKKKDITKAKNEIEIDSKSLKNYFSTLPIPGGKTMQKDFKKPQTFSAFKPTEEEEENEKKQNITKAKNETEIDSKSLKNYFPTLPIPGGKTMQKDFKKPPTLAGFGPTEEEEKERKKEKDNAKSNFELDDSKSPKNEPLPILPIPAKKDIRKNATKPTTLSGIASDSRSKKPTLSDFDGGGAKLTEMKMRNNGRDDNKSVEKVNQKPAPVFESKEELPTLPKPDQQKRENLAIMTKAILMKYKEIASTDSGKTNNDNKEASASAMAKFLPKPVRVSAMPKPRRHRMSRSRAESASKSRSKPFDDDKDKAPQKKKSKKIEEPKTKDEQEMMAVEEDNRNIKPDILENKLKIENVTKDDEHDDKKSIVGGGGGNRNKNETKSKPKVSKTEIEKKPKLKSKRLVVEKKPSSSRGVKKRQNKSSSSTLQRTKLPFDKDKKTKQSSSSSSNNFKAKASNDKSKKVETKSATSQQSISKDNNKAKRIKKSITNVDDKSKTNDKNEEMVFKRKSKSKTKTTTTTTENDNSKKDGTSNESMVFKRKRSKPRSKPKTNATTTTGIDKSKSNIDNKSKTSDTSMESIFKRKKSKSRRNTIDSDEFEKS